MEAYSKWIINELNTMQLIKHEIIFTLYNYAYSYTIRVNNTLLNVSYNRLGGKLFIIQINILQQNLLHLDEVLPTFRFSSLTLIIRLHSAFRP